MSADFRLQNICSCTSATDSYPEFNGVQSVTVVTFDSALYSSSWSTVTSVVFMETLRLFRSRLCQAASNVSVWDFRLTHQESRVLLNHWQQKNLKNSRRSLRLQWVWTLSFRNLTETVLNLEFIILDKQFWARWENYEAYVNTWRQLCKNKIRI